MPGTLNLVPGGVKAQARQALQNLVACLEESGASLDSVLKCTCMLDNINDFEAFNEVRTTIRILGNDIAFIVRGTK